MKMSKSQISKAATPEEIRRLCGPQPLEGEMMRYFMETDDARDPHQNTRQLLSQALESQKDERILFYGHRGCGKSTELVKRIVMARIDKSAMEEEALELLIHKTGGVLRHAFQVLQTAAAMSDVEIPLAYKHIRYGLNKLRQELARQITLPRDNQQWGGLTVSKLFDRLQEYARLQESGKPIPVVSDPANQILLQSCALVEYNGEGWLGVHPLIVEHLKKMGRLS